MTRGAAAIGLAAAVMCAGCQRDHERLRHPPVVVMSPIRLEGAVVRGAPRTWWRAAAHLVRYGDPLPVGVSMYCLRGTTRQGRYVRAGIVAADPRFFPLSRYIELYVGRKFLGRFLVDDTGLRIIGARIDVWTPDCREASRFGLQRGTAVLVRPDAPEIRQAGAVNGAK